MVEMERCKNCNNIREDGSFCPFCGYAHDTTVGQPPVQSINSAAQVTYQNSTQPQAFYQNPMPPQMVYQPDTKKKMGGKIFVAVFLGILLLAGIGAVMTFVLMPKIPDLVGEQEEAAIEILKDMDYGKKEYSIEYEYDDRVEKGEVIEQFPHGGKKTFKKEIELIISLGPEEFEIGTVIGLSKEEAIKELEDQGLAVNLMEEYSDEPIGNVIGQNPSKGETVQMEDEITLTISKGPDENIIQFKDSAFEKAVLDILGLQSGEPITRDLVKDIKELNLEDLDILSIEGIEAFESLEYLNASNNLIEEINELPSSLVYLDLSLNSLTELDLSSYTHLETAMVYMNELTKLPKFPSSIIEIDVSYNEIVDVSELKNYSKLKSVNVSDNLIEDFSALEEIYENLEYAFAEYNPGSFAFGEGSEDPSDGYTWATAMNPSYGINNSIIELFPYYHNLYISLLGVSIDDLLGVFSGLELTADDGNEQEYSYSDGGNRFVFYIDKETKSCVYYEFRLLDDPYFEGDLVISTEENNMGEDVVLLLGLPSEVFVGSYYVFLTYYTTDAVYKLIFDEEDSIFMLIVWSNESYFE